MSSENIEHTLPITDHPSNRPQVEEKDRQLDKTPENNGAPAEVEKTKLVKTPENNGDQAEVEKTKLVKTPENNGAPAEVEKTKLVKTPENNGDQAEVEKTKLVKTPGNNGAPAEVEKTKLVKTPENNGAPAEVEKTKLVKTPENNGDQAEVEKTKLVKTPEKNRSQTGDDYQPEDNLLGQKTDGSTKHDNLISQVFVYLRDNKTYFMAQSATIVLSALFGAVVVNIPHMIKHWHNETNVVYVPASEKVIDLKEFYSNMTNVSQTCQYVTKELKEEFQKNISRTRNELEDLIKQTKKTVQELNVNQHTLKGEQEYVESKSTSQDTFYIAVFLLAIGEVVILLVVWKKVPTGIHTVMVNSHREPVMTMEPQNGFPQGAVKQKESAILDRIVRKPLEKSVCVVSFYGGTPHRNHMTLSRSFVNQSTKFEEMVVNKHEDILRIPPSKVMLVHIDFNARNIILEDPAREIGDLKRQTVMALQKMGAEVFLIYYEERNARPIKDGHLYNSQLGSVTIHTVLRQLNANQRVISVSDGSQLTTHQKQHLQTSVSSILN